MCCVCHYTLVKSRYRHYGTVHKLSALRHSTVCTLSSLLLLHTGTAALCVIYGLQETVTWDSLLAGPLGGGERYRFTSAMLFRRLVYGSSGSSQSCLDHAGIEGAYRHSLALAAQPKLSHTFTARSPPTPTPTPSTTQPPPLFLMNQSPGFRCKVFLTNSTKYTLINNHGKKPHGLSIVTKNLTLRKFKPPFTSL
jgi:hypothetical protein